MIEWVNCLKLKLRELKILSPKENIYVKPPGMKPILQSTRNPRDPLPSRPQHMNVSNIPGLELTQSMVQHNNAVASEGHVEGEDYDDFVTSQTENLLDTLNISTVDIEDETADPITIPVFNFSTSNTTSQNLINLLSNPLRHTANGSNFTPFEDAFNEPDDLDDDVEGAHEHILPTSLQIDYIPEEHEQLQSLPRDNITVIKIAENENSSHTHKVNDPKVTKIKIEMDYDQLFNATSSAPVEIKVEPLPKAVEAPIQAPSTSTESAANGIDAKEMLKIEVEKPPPLPATPRKAPATPKKTPMHEKRKLSLREKQVLQLKNEIGNEIRFKLRKKDCVDSIAFVPTFNSVWIAGFKPNPLLYCLHVGDQLLAINNIVIKSPADAQKYIKMCSGLFVEVTIRRLPLAGVFLLRREFDGQCLGIIRDGNSPAIVEIIPNSISSDIPPRPISQDEDATWIITQINFRNLSLICHKKYDETELLLNSSGLETSLLLQPSDFIAKIKKELKAMKNYRDYTLQ
jgi:hypothetical protein